MYVYMCVGMSVGRYYIHVWQYFLRKPTCTNINAIKAICPIYVLYF